MRTRTRVVAWVSICFTGYSLLSSMTGYGFMLVMSLVNTDIRAAPELFASTASPLWLVKPLLMVGWAYLLKGRAWAWTLLVIAICLALLFGLVFVFATRVYFPVAVPGMLLMAISLCALLTDRPSTWAKHEEAQA